MDNKRFNELVDEIRAASIETLIAKNGKYATNSADALHNFRDGSAITGDTMAQTCWGYMAKHLVALRDMVIANRFDDRDDFKEKVQDSINYLCILWAIGNEQRDIMRMALNWEQGKADE